MGEGRLRERGGWELGAILPPASKDIIIGPGHTH